MIEFDEYGNIKRPLSVKARQWFEESKKYVKEMKGVEHFHNKNRKFFVCVVLPENYLKCLDNGLWATEKKSTLENAKKGDILIFYIAKEKEFGIIAEVISEQFYADTQIWRDGLYPHRVKIEALDHPISRKQINQELIDKLDFIKHKDFTWGQILQRSMIEISEKDFTEIFNFGFR